jgi:hypothetical protein
MAATDVPLTLADFARCNWETAVAEADKKETFSYCIQFNKRLRQAMENGDSVAAAVFTVLFVVTDIELRPENVDEPFGPRFVARSARGVLPGDLTDEQYGLLAELAGSVVDSEMRARLCDLVWVVKRNHQLAGKAAEAYVESARTWEDPVNWVTCIARIGRAVRLARSLGNGGSSEFEKAVAYAEELLTRLNGEDPGFMSCQLMEILQSVKKGDPVRYAALATKAARRAEAAGGNALFRANQYWYCAAEWHGIAKNAEAREAALIAAAETHVMQAEEAATKPRESAPNLIAAGHLERAVHALQKSVHPPR